MTKWFASRGGLFSGLWMAVLTGLLAGCNTVSPWAWPQTVEISQAQLMDKLSQQFPMRDQVLALLDVTAMAPRLTLQPDNNRVLADVDISARDRLFQKTYQGSLWLSFGLKYEPRDATIRLSSVTIDKVHLQGLPANYERTLTRLGAWLAEERLQNFAVHRLTAEQLAQVNRHGLQVADVKITHKGVVSQFES